MKDLIKRAQSKLACIAERENFRLKGKKIIMTLAAVLCCAMISTVFTSCGGDGDDENKNTGGDNKTVAVSMKAGLSVSDDMINYLDLTVDYYDANGQIQSEPMTEKKWERTIKANFPATLGVRLKAQLKDGIDPTSIALFNAESWISYRFEYLDSKGGITSEFGRSHGGEFSIEGSKITDWLNKDGGKIKEILYNFDADGKWSEGSW